MRNFLGRPIKIQIGDKVFHVGLQIDRLIEEYLTGKQFNS